MFKLNKEVPIEDLISRQIKFWQKDAKSAPPKQEFKPNLTITRQYGSRAMEVAELVGKFLNWRIYDKEIVDYIANNVHIHKNMVEMFDEKTRTGMDDFLSTFLNKNSIGKEKFFKHLVQTITTIGKYGHHILIGRGAGLILPDKFTFKVCIIEDFSDRQVNLSRANAGVLISDKQIIKQDEERKNFYKKNFYKKPDEPSAYDVVINLSKSGTKAAAQMILSGLKTKFSLTDESLKYKNNVRK